MAAAPRPPTVAAQQAGHTSPHHGEGRTMTTQSTSIITGQSQRGRLRWALGALAALTLAAGVAAWQTRGREATGPTVSVPTTRGDTTGATVVAGGEPAAAYVLVETADDVPAARARL